MGTLYQAVKDCINSHVRTYVAAKGGEVLPIENDTHVKLKYYGGGEDHELLALRLAEDGRVIVESIVDGQREDDDFKTFSNEEMWDIATFFIAGE